MERMWQVKRRNRVEKTLFRSPHTHKYVPTAIVAFITSNAVTKHVLSWRSNMYCKEVEVANNKPDLSTLISFAFITWSRNASTDRWPVPGFLFPCQRVELLTWNNTYHIQRTGYTKKLNHWPNRMQMEGCFLSQGALLQPVVERVTWDRKRLQEANLLFHLHQQPSHYQSNASVSTYKTIPNGSQMQ